MHHLQKKKKKPMQDEQERSPFGFMYMLRRQKPQKGSFFFRA